MGRWEEARNPLPGWWLWENLWDTYTAYTLAYTLACSTDCLTVRRGEERVKVRVCAVIGYRKFN
jgi:hypothetical protein